MVRGTADNFQSEVKESTVLAVVDFYSDSCMPCKRMSPILAELEEEYGERLKLVKVSINANPELIEQYEILSAPTLVLFMHGEERERKTGFIRKDDLREIINQILEETI